MRTHRFLIVLALIILCCFISCKDAQDESAPSGTSKTTGSLRVVDYTAPSDKSSISIGRYNLLLIDSDGNEKTVSGTSLPITISDLEIGNWTYTFECYDSNGDLIASHDDNEIEIEPYKRISTAIDLGSSDFKDMVFGISKETGYIRIRPFAKSNAVLENLEIPDKVDDITVRGIAINGFKDCSAIKSIVKFPETLTVIGENAFQNCTGLTSVTVPDHITSLGSNSFNGCSNLVSATLGKGIAQINTGTFRGCRKLDSVTINGQVSTIGSYAFYQCTSLCTNKNGVLTLLDNVQTIGDSAFEQCKSLKSVTVPQSVKYIRSNAFSSCTNLSEIILTDDIESIGSGAFSYTAISVIDLPENEKYTTVEGIIFRGCSNLKSIDIPPQVKTIAWAAFDNCASLEKVNLNDKVEYIGSRCFANCSSLKSIFIPKSTKTVDFYLFENCSGIAINIEAKIDEVNFDNLWLDRCSDYVVAWEASK